MNWNATVVLLPMHLKKTSQTDEKSNRNLSRDLLAWKKSAYSLATTSTTFSFVLFFFNFPEISSG